MPTTRLGGIVLAALLPMLVPLLTAQPAHAHGSMEDPISRVHQCYTENPERPDSAACAAAIAASGKQAFYDWNGVRIGDAAGRHRQLIPDGQLCSAGNEKFHGLDLARADWKATRLPDGGSYTFRFRVTAQHVGTFRLYVTDSGYDPTKPLSWSDLESEPFLTVENPRVVDGSYVLPGRLPGDKQGRHLIYAIWQRSDSPEAFYSCSDVVFDGAEQAPSGTPGQDQPPGETPDEHGHGTGSSPASTTPAGNDPSRTTTSRMNAAPSTDTPAPDDAGIDAAAPVRQTLGPVTSSVTDKGDARAAETGTLADTGFTPLPLVLAGGTMLTVGIGTTLIIRGRRATGRHRLLCDSKRHRR